MTKNRQETDQTSLLTLPAYHDTIHIRRVRNGWVIGTSCGTDSSRPQAVVADVGPATMGEVLSPFLEAMKNKPQ